jgi:NAD(P)H-hydrate epimerase
MKILRSDQVKEVDGYTIEKEPIHSIQLMERASGQISAWVAEHIRPNRRIHLFIGPGNNGGDGLAIARQLADQGYMAEVWLVKISSKLSPDAQVNLERLHRQNLVPIHQIEDESGLPDIKKDELIVDGLFGSGLNRPLEGFPAKVVRHLNRMPALRIAIDIPSGLFGEDNSSNTYDTIFRADYTLTFQFPSLSFFFPENQDVVGEWHVLDIGLMQEKMDELDSPYYMITRKQVGKYLCPRKRFAHKGHFGHVLMITGGYGKMGAAVLSSKAALRAGSGLVTTHVPRLGYEIMQTALPEAMISLDISDIIFSQPPDLGAFATVGTGPGLGTKENTQNALLTLIERARGPIVLDADALNILGMHPDWLEKLPEGSILTPHPREFERLTRPVSGHYERIGLQQEFAQRYQVYLVLKGGNTSVACPDGRVYFNAAGNPGMATGGSGDVLTGMITSLLGQGYEPKQAAIAGVYLHALAGDMAAKRQGQEALIASDIIESIGFAYKCVQNDEE